jgi:peptidoglycan/xylan/chitin deacetylase (PgdA/CDA1 family)
MRELIAAARHDCIPPRSVAVTFDDGYSDNLHAAAGWLAVSEVPATVFVTTGVSYRCREFWWDELERVLLAQQSLPAALNLTIAGQRLHWRLESDECERMGQTAARPVGNRVRSRGSPDMDPGPALLVAEQTGNRTNNETEPWNVLETRRPTRRQAVYLELCSRIRPLSASERDAIMSALRSWAGVDDFPRATHQRLTDCELRVLAGQPNIEIGAHTVTHPVLSTLNNEDQKREIVGSRTRLSEITGQPIVGFSYPYGQRRDYSLQSVAIVRECGFAYACSNFPGYVTSQSDLFQMPRYVIRDWRADEFAARLEGWLDG